MPTLDSIYDFVMLGLMRFSCFKCSLLCVFSEDEVNLLVIIVDTNPIWWGKQALKESQVRLPEGLCTVLV